MSHRTMKKIAILTLNQMPGQTPGGIDASRRGIVANLM